jgi:hypothetical protein
MTKRLLILFAMLGVLFGQSGFDILNIPTDARGAALGMSLSPTVKPTRILTHPEQSATLSVWNWVADVQGAYIGLGLKNVFLNFQAISSGELEYRKDVPSEEPLSTFQYPIYNTGGSYALELGDFILGLGGELVYERTLNASATGLSLNLATAYSLNQSLLLSAGLRHFGTTGKLVNESSTLPTELWLAVDADLNNLTLLAELNDGPIPAAIGASYSLLDKFEILGGLQVEAADSETRLHPSAGFTTVWTSFRIGYAIYQMDNNLGPRHYISLYWNY